MRGRIQNRAKEGTEAPGEGQSMRISGISVRRVWPKGEGGSGTGEVERAWVEVQAVTGEQLCG